MLALGQAPLHTERNEYREEKGFQNDGKMLGLCVPKHADWSCLIHHSCLFFSASSSGFVEGRHRTYQAKDDPPEGCLMIPGEENRTTTFYYFLFVFPDPQQMVEDIIRPFHQPWVFHFVCIISILRSGDQ